MARFSSANAKAMAARSAAARQAAKAQRDVPPAPAAVQAGANGDQALGIDASRVRVRLETLDSLMAKAKTDREWDNLSRAYDRLFKVLMVVTRTPGPGQYKSRPVPEQRRRMWAEPVIPFVPQIP